MSQVSKVWRPITKAGSSTNAPRDGQGESDIGSETVRLESAYKKPCMPGSFPGGQSELADFCK